MASVVRIQIRRRSPKPLLVWLNRKVAARVEARALLVMAGKNGDTIDSVRELISVRPEIEALLQSLRVGASDSGQRDRDEPAIQAVGT